MFKGFDKGFRGLVSGLVLMSTVSCAVAVTPAAEPQPVREISVETTATEVLPVAETTARRAPESTEQVTVEQTAPTKRVLRRLQGREVNAALVAKAREIVHEHHAEPFGTEIAFEVEGRGYVGRIEQHYHPEGGALRPWGYHPGCSLFAIETSS